MEQQELEVETAPRAALSSVCLLLSQAARTLKRAAAAKVVRVRVIAGSLQLTEISLVTYVRLDRNRVRTGISDLGVYLS